MESKISKHHSVTFYIPHSDLKSFTAAIKQASVQIFGTDKKNTISKYIRGIIYKDLESRGLLEKGKNTWETPK